MPSYSDDDDDDEMIPVWKVYIDVKVMDKWGDDYDEGDDNGDKGSVCVDWVALSMPSCYRIEKVSKTCEDDDEGDASDGKGPLCVSRVALLMHICYRREQKSLKSGP